MGLGKHSFTEAGEERRAVSLQVASPEHLTFVSSMLDTHRHTPFVSFGGFFQTGFRSTPDVNVHLMVLSQINHKSSTFVIVDWNKPFPSGSECSRGSFPPSQREVVGNRLGEEEEEVRDELTVGGKEATVREAGRLETEPAFSSSFLSTNTANSARLSA